MKYNNYIFDFDGTLFDTLPSYAEAYMELSKQNGFSDSYDEVFSWFSKYGTVYAIKQHDWGCKYSEADHKLTPIKERIASLKAKPFDGAEELLNEIKQRGGVSYLFSDNYLPYVKQLLDRFHLSHYFKCILCCSGGERSYKLKPDPDGLIFLAQKYKLLSGETICIGDRESDVLAASAAGFDSALLDSYGFGETVGCNIYLRKLSDMCDYL